MKFHAWILLLLSAILTSCSTVKTPSKDPGTFTGQPIETKPTLPPGPELPTPAPTEDGTEVTELPSQGSKPVGPTYPVENVKKVFTVKIEGKNYEKYPGAIDKLNQAEKMITKIMNSKEYKEAVLNFEFNGKKQFHDNEGLSNDQIYEKLFGGAEALMPALNYQMDLTVEMYHSNNRTVGYTYPSVMSVYTNWKFHRNYEPCRIASNIVHEWTHKMGFGHDSRSNWKRPYSVPYAHNTIIESLCDKADKGQLTEL